MGYGISRNAKKKEMRWCIRDKPGVFRVLHMCVFIRTFCFVGGINERKMGFKSKHNKANPRCSANEDSVAFTGLTLSCVVDVHPVLHEN